MLFINKHEIMKQMNNININLNNKNIDFDLMKRIIDVGYCLFTKKHEISVPQISMREFYFETTDTTEEQEHLLKKIVYIFHYDEKRIPKNPVAIKVI